MTAPQTRERWRFARLLPTSPLARSLALQSGLYAVGSGVFLAGSAVFFTTVVGLSASQVGLGISVAGLVSLALSVPLGRLADRVGSRRTWARSTPSHLASGSAPRPTCAAR